MHTPTTDQTDRHDPGCRCWRTDVCGYLCPKCARELQQEELRAWVETFGSPMWQGRKWGKA